MMKNPILCLASVVMPLFCAALLSSCQKEDVQVSVREDVVIDIPDFTGGPDDVLVSATLVDTKSVAEAVQNATKSFSETGLVLDEFAALAGDDAPSLMSGFDNIVYLVQNIVDLTEVKEFLHDLDIETDIELRTYRINYKSKGGVNGAEDVILSADVSYLADKQNRFKRHLESVSLFSVGYGTAYMDISTLNDLVAPARAAHNALAVFPHCQGMVADAGAHLVAPAEFLQKSRQTIDAEIAALQLVKLLDDVTMMSQYYTENIGESNGGGVSLGVHYLLENDPDYKKVNEEYIHLAATYIDEGNLSYTTTFPGLMNTPDSPDGLTFPLTPNGLMPSMYLANVVSSIYSHPEMFVTEDKTYVEEDYFKEDFLSLGFYGRQWIPYFKTGTMSMAMMAFFYKGGMTGIVKEDVLDETGNIDVNNPAIKCLMDVYALNDVMLGGWSPKKPVKFAHSTIDEFVNFDDVKAVAENLTKGAPGWNVKVSTNSFFGHFTSVYYWLFLDIMLKKHPCPLV